jgi:hypothetical protein
MIPKNWEELLIWLAMQFPVLGACAAVVWWILRWTGTRQEAEMKRVDEQNVKLLAEKERRVAERDQRIGELKAEIEELKRKLSRSPTKEKDTDGGAKP